MGKLLRFPTLKHETSPTLNTWADVWGTMSALSVATATYEILSVHDSDPCFHDEAGIELSVLFPSLAPPKGELGGWCKMTDADKDHWLITVQRQDGKSVSGRVRAFSVLSKGLVAHVPLLNGFAEYLPSQDHANHLPQKLVFLETVSKRRLLFVTKQYALSM